VARVKLVSGTTVSVTVSLTLTLTRAGRFCPNGKKRPPAQTVQLFQFSTLFPTPKPLWRQITSRAGGLKLKFAPPLRAGPEWKKCRARKMTHRSDGEEEEEEEEEEEGEEKNDKLGQIRALLKRTFGPN